MAVAEDRLTGSREAASFLRELADPARAPIAAADLAIVIAHPDDETIGCRAQLGRLVGAKLIFVTDGAPHKSGRGAQAWLFQPRRLCVRADSVPRSRRSTCRKVA